MVFKPLQDKPRVKATINVKTLTRKGAKGRLRAPSWTIQLKRDISLKQTTQFLMTGTHGEETFWLLIFKLKPDCGLLLEVAFPFP